MRNSICVLLAVLTTGMPAYAIHTENRNHTVTRLKPIAYGKYIVQSEDTYWVLNTTPAEDDKFEAGTGKVITTKKHVDMWVIPEPQSDYNNEVLVTAKSPLIPRGEGSYVFVAGKFQDRVPDGGGGGGGGGGAPTVPDKPAWSSQIKAPAVHVILLHLYGPTIEDANWEPCLIGSANDLAKLYQGEGDVVHIVKIGQGKHISSIAGLPAYLNGIGVGLGSVVTLDTLGHTKPATPAGYMTFLLMSANGLNVEYVGNPAHFDLAGELNPKMATSTFCGYFKAYLKPEAFIALYHCETARPYIVQPPTNPPTTASALYLQVLAEVGPARQVCGVLDLVNFRSNLRPRPTPPMGSFKFAGYKHL